jgi:hypothetical protein
MKVLKELTEWQVDFRQPNHTYLMNGDKIIAYRVYHDGEVRPAHGHRLDQRYRKFEEIPYVAADWNGFGDVDPAVIRIQGSGKNSYEINTDKETCSCPGFTFRGACKHIQQYKERVNA